MMKRSELTTALGSLRMARRFVLLMLPVAPAVPVAAQVAVASTNEVSALPPDIVVRAPVPVGVSRRNEAVDYTRSLKLDVAVDPISALRIAPQPTETRRLQRPGNETPLIAPIASMILPGSGQALLKQQRSLGYVVADAFLWIRAIRSDRADRRARREYRDVAAAIARRGFGSILPDGPWEYYEEMEKYQSSGMYDRGSGGPLQPETDLTTYNGKQWELARSQYWADPDVPPATTSPEYKNAIDYYSLRAVKDSFRWSWRDHAPEFEAYRELIKESNRSNQDYVTAISLVAANHFISMVDAYVTVRMRRFGGAGLLSTAAVNTKILPIGTGGERSYGMAWSVTVPVGHRR